MTTTEPVLCSLQLPDAEIVAQIGLPRFNELLPAGAIARSSEKMY
jgi:hypothetical protein